MSSNTILNLGTGGLESRTLWGNILLALSLFIILLFLTDVPGDIEAGRNGQKALKELDSMSALMLEIKALTSEYHSPDNYFDIQSALNTLRRDAESSLHHYQLVSEYNSYLRKNVEAYSLAFN